MALTTQDQEPNKIESKVSVFRAFMLNKIHLYFYWDS